MLGHDKDWLDQTEKRYQALREEAEHLLALLRMNGRNPDQLPIPEPAKVKRLGGLVHREKAKPKAANERSGIREAIRGALRHTSGLKSLDVFQVLNAQRFPADSPEDLRRRVSGELSRMARKRLLIRTKRGVYRLREPREMQEAENTNGQAG